MMNKSKIEWTDFTWNPVTGCLSNCEYCYAMPQLRRFAGDIRLNKGSPQLIKYAADLYILPHPFKSLAGTVLPSPVGTTPTFHEYRLQMPAQKKKPANIFVCSMADLFGEWVPDEWIRRVFEACEAAPWHNYLFLTKNPSRYLRLAESGNLPKRENFWYGTTATKPESMVFYTADYNTFVSVEPIEAYFGEGSYPEASWIIVGAETGNRRGKITPQREWIEGIVEAAEITGAPILLKDSAEMKAVWGDELIQEFPESLQHPADAPIPHCKECEYCIIKLDGKRGSQCFCRMGSGKGEPVPQHIGGRYTRTCPPWCRLRSGDNSVGQKWEHELLKKSTKRDIMDNIDNISTENQPKTMGDKPTSQSGNDFIPTKKPVITGLLKPRCPLWQQNGNII